MTRREITELLGQYEEDHAVEEYIYNGIHVWPILKMLTAFSLYVPDSGKQKAKTLWSKFLYYLKTTSARSTFFIGLLKHLIINRKKNCSLNQTEVDFLALTASTDRRVKIDDKYYDIFFDPLISSSPEYKFLLLENNCKNIFFPYSSSVYIHHKLAAISLAQRCSSIFFHGREQRWFKEYDQFNRMLGIENITWAKAEQAFKTIITKSAYFGKILKKTNPRAVIMTNWYGQTQMAMSIAADRAGICSVDLQHGMQSKDHFGYSFWLKGPECGYECIPDKFWVWGSDNVKTLTEFNRISDFHECNILVGGYPFLNTFIGKGENKNLGNIFPGHEDKKILYSLQSGSDVELCQRIIRNSPAHWAWFVRLHPKMNLKSFLKINQTLSKDGFNVECKTSTKSVIYDLFNYVDAHITPFSTCALEALPFGIKTVLVHINGKISFANYIARNLMFYSEDISKITAYIASHKKQKIDSHSIFAAPENTARQLARILHEN